MEGELGETGPPLAQLHGAGALGKDDEVQVLLEEGRPAQLRHLLHDPFVVAPDEIRKMVAQRLERLDGGTLLRPCRFEMAVDDVLDDAVEVPVHLPVELLPVKLFDEIPQRRDGDEVAEVQRLGQKGVLVVLGLHPDRRKGIYFQFQHLVLEWPVVEAVCVIHGEDHILPAGDPLEVLDPDVHFREEVVVGKKEEVRHDQLSERLGHQSDLLQIFDIDHLLSLFFSSPAIRRRTRSSSCGVSTSTESCRVSTTLIR